MLHWSENKDAAATVRCMGCRSQLTTSHDLRWHPANKSPSKSLRRKYGTNIPLFDILLLIQSWHYWHCFWGRALFLMFNISFCSSVLQWNVITFGLLPSVNKLEMQRIQAVTRWKYQQSLSLETWALQIYKPYLTRPVHCFCHAQGPDGTTEATSPFDVAKPAQKSCPTPSPPGDTGISVKNYPAPLPGHAAPSWQFLLRVFLLQSISLGAGDIAAQCRTTTLFAFKKKLPVEFILLGCRSSPAWGLQHGPPHLLGTSGQEHFKTEYLQQYVLVGFLLWQNGLVQEFHSFVLLCFFSVFAVPLLTETSGNRWLWQLPFTWDRGEKQLPWRGAGGCEAMGRCGWHRASREPPPLLSVCWGLRAVHIPADSSV